MCFVDQWEKKEDPRETTGGREFASVRLLSWEIRCCTCTRMLYLRQCWQVGKNVHLDDSDERQRE